MIVEMRTYTLKAGSDVEGWLEYWAKNAWPVQQKMPGKLVGYYVSDVGNLNQIIHMWQFDSYAQRAEKAKLMRGEEWLEIRRNMPDLVIAQENRILKAAPFSPMP